MKTAQLTLLILFACVWGISLRADTEKELAIVAKQKQLEEREQAVKQRESTLKEQIASHVRVMQELQEKFSKEKKMIEEKQQQREAELNKKLSEKDQELKKKSIELESVRDHRAKSYRLIYEKMEAKNAAKILENIEAQLAIQILGDMKEQKAADILSKMSPDKARAITEYGFGKRHLSSTQGNPNKNSHKVNEANEKNPIAPIGE